MEFWVYYHPDEEDLTCFAHTEQECIRIYCSTHFKQYVEENGDEVLDQLEFITIDDGRKPSNKEEMIGFIEDQGGKILRGKLPKK
jgi:hypothetical protein